MKVCVEYSEYNVKEVQEQKVHTALTVQSEILRAQFARDILALRDQHQWALDTVKKTIASQQTRHESDIRKVELQLATKLRKAHIELREERIAHEVTKGKLEVQTETAHRAMSAPRTVVNNVAPQTTINNTTNNVYIANLTTDIGKKLACRIGHEQFWQGQIGIARELRCLTDAAGNKCYRVKDENRGKFEVNVEGEIERDDGASRLIGIVKTPVVEQIGNIKDELLQKAEEDLDTLSACERLNTIRRAYDQCLAFKDPLRNRKFILGLTGKTK